MTVIVATGMRAEAALLPPGVRAVVGGGDPAQLRRMLDAAAEGATAVLSFGIAGGLDTGLECGALVVATRVRAPGGAWPADATWSSALVRASGARFGVVAGANTVVSGPDAKRSLRLMTDALVVDLESAVAAAFAASRGLPFAGAARRGRHGGRGAAPRGGGRPLPHGPPGAGPRGDGAAAPAERVAGAGAGGEAQPHRAGGARQGGAEPAAAGRSRAPPGQRHGLEGRRQPFAFWYNFCAISRISWGW
jgi:hypothetical protein